MRRQTVELFDFKREEKAVAYLPTTTRGDEVRVKAKEGSRASSLNGWLLMVQDWPVDEREASQGQRVVDAAAAGMAEKCVAGRHHDKGTRIPWRTETETETVNPSRRDRKRPNRGV
jgi:hypothetical protein